MPLHAQIACIGGNGVFALLFLIAALGSGSPTECSTATTGGFGLAAFLLILAAAAAYTCWVLVKFRHYLSAEQSRERELHVEKLLLEIEALKARIPS